MLKHLLILIAIFSSLVSFCQKNNSARTLVDTYLTKAAKLTYDDWNQSKKYINLANEISEKSEDEAIRNSFYKQAANIYYNRDIFDVALKYSLESYDYFRKNDSTQASEVENLIAIINARMNNEQEALKHFRNIYLYNRRIKNFDLEAKALNNIGTIYRSSKKPDSALFYYQKAIYSSRHTQDLAIQIVSHTNLAKVLAEKNRNAEAEKNFLYVEKLLKNNDNPTLASNLYVSLSSFYLDNNKEKLAVYYAEKAQEFSKIKYSFQNRDVLQTLYKAYYAKGDYKKSTEYFQQYDNVRDSLNIEEKAVNIEKGKIEAEFKSKEQKIELENSKKTLKFVYVILALIVIVSALFLFLMRYKNNLINEKLEKELSVSRENELKLDLELRNKELVSKTLMETEKISIHQNFIEEIQQGIKSDDAVEIKKELNSIIYRLNKNIRQTSSWDEFNFRFTNVYDSFYERLAELHPHLNQSEKKLCAYIKLNLISKDIAELTNTSVKSVENSRTRLRRKLGLTNTNTELHKYLSEI